LSEAQSSTAPAGIDYLTGFAALRDSVEARLDELTPPPAGSAPRLRRAARYSLLDGGKRLRPVAALLTTQALGGDPDRVLDIACAIEMVHTASLIIDDLPCMDDAEQRRGKRANHLVHGEDIAILSSISLISEAFGIISRAADVAPAVKVDVIQALSDAIGFEGLCAGQERDLRDIDDDSNAEALEQLQQQKTGALFVFCFEVGARVAGLTSAEAEPLRRFGHHAGLAFQILDDLLDLHGDAASTGKDHAQDVGKHTYAAIMSADEAEARARAEIARALDALTPAAVDPAPFRAFLDLVVHAYDGQLNGESQKAAVLHKHG